MSALDCFNRRPFFAKISRYGTRREVEVRIIKINTTMIEEGIKEAGFLQKLSKIQTENVVKVIHKYFEQFGSGDNLLGKIDKYPVNISLNLDKPYPHIIKKALYPTRPRNIIGIQRHG